MTRDGRPSRRADLHLHSTCSDGLWSPEQVVQRAARAGIGTIALTDHDTLSGLDAAAREATAQGLELIPGVEISVEHPSGGERHVLAYGIDPSDRALRDALDENVAERSARLGRMLDALATVGVRIEPERVHEHAHGTIGRPHVADAMVRQGLCKSRQEAFDRFLGDGRIGHVRKRNLDAARAIAVVHAAGGVAVLAHPGRRWDPALIEDFVRVGLDGLEAWHPSNSASDQRALTSMAQRWGLLLTGGSDCHGDPDGAEMLRTHRVSAEVADRVLERVASARAGRA